MFGRHDSNLGSRAGTQSTDTMSYLAKLSVSFGRCRKLIGYRRIQPVGPTSPSVTPATQTVSPWAAEGFGAALTVMRTRRRAGTVGFSNGYSTVCPNNESMVTAPPRPCCWTRA